MAKKIPIVARMEADAEARCQYAKLLFDAQGDQTREIVMRMIDTMHSMVGQGYVKIRAGKNEQTLPIPYETQQKNFLWVAMKIFVTLAEMDIQVGNFTPPENICATCGKSTTVRKRKARRAMS